MASDDEDVSTASLEQARMAKEKLTVMVRQEPAVNGIGISRNDDGFYLKINFAADPSSHVPNEIDGVPIYVEVIGAIGKQASA